ncbi:hypothetical protein LTS07_004280 [Exophiala sideris]|uniref:Transcription factor domain-containing protein n=1 Tax=Exophiala sideris TaxID=1016849 RepID=A0ABR0JER3_9EURO|nr:hypothetical protein LTS07_004280 [Exophiala sideris]KAK5062394.1 hypothetical protein LTR69_004752 [Exophiala sideris]KAK5177552.1 hypothetical protein LTR44_009962 [Eurotiomycetes sp. CCFEE 6388]
MAAFQPVFEESFVVAEDDPSIESLVQEQMISIGVLTTGVLKDVFLKEQLSVVATREHKLKLADWVRRVPAAMQLDSLTKNKALTSNQRRSVFLVHVNYMGALLLLYRRHLFYLATTHRDVPWQLDGDMTEALGYAEDAVATALQSARLLHLLMSERAIFKRKRLHGAGPVEYDEELSQSRSCLDTLEYCSQGDVVAKGYHDMLHFYYNALNTPPVNACNGTGEQLQHTEAFGHTTMHTLASRGRSLHPNDLVNRVGSILDWPYQHGWPSDRHEIISSVDGTNIFPELGFEPQITFASTTGLYYDSPVFGGPFQWSANSVPPPSRT